LHPGRGRDPAPASHPPSRSGSGPRLAPASPAIRVRPLQDCWPPCPPAPRSAPCGSRQDQPRWQVAFEQRRSSPRSSNILWVLMPDLAFRTAESVSAMGHLRTTARVASRKSRSSAVSPCVSASRLDFSWNESAATLPSRKRVPAPRCASRARLAARSARMASLGSVPYDHCAVAITAFEGFLPVFALSIRSTVNDMLEYRVIESGHLVQKAPLTWPGCPELLRDVGGHQLVR